MLLYTCISMYNHISCIFSIAIKVVLIIIAFFLLCYGQLVTSTFQRIIFKLPEAKKREKFEDTNWVIRRWKLQVDR